MIKSMTGFAALTVEDSTASATVTIRAVNHRHLDLQVRMPVVIGALEPRLRSLAQQRLARGRVELSVTVQSWEPVVPEVEVNEAFVSRLSEAIERVRARGLVGGQLSPGDLVRLPHALTIREPPADQNMKAASGMAVLVEGAVSRALAELDAMRMGEGAHLEADLANRCRSFEYLIVGIQEAAAEGTLQLQERLRGRVAELTESQESDPVTIAQEIVRFAQRSDITEEVVRLRSHLAQWAGLVASPEPCGRKLDFLVQEMNREINTIGSKADGVRVSELIIDAKAELERIREQVQNVE